MPFLSNPAGNRQLVLLCVRLLVQSAVAWSTPQLGMYGLQSLHLPHGISSNIARHEQGPITPESDNGFAALLRTRQRRLPS
jgi:hypothetical protein